MRLQHPSFINERKNSLEKQLKINDHSLDFMPGETILDVARRNHIDIPTLCHLPMAKRATGACRLCIVEIEGRVGLFTSCNTKAEAGMSIHTHSKSVRAARKNIIELLLVSGNHNCSVRGISPMDWTDFQLDVQEYDQSPQICVAYGQCELQKLAYEYQVTQGRLPKREIAYELEYKDSLIGRDFSRCILCGRCVQVCNEVMGNRALSIAYRGSGSKIIATGDMPLNQSDCRFCGTCVQECPVGALFETKNRYQRPWEGERIETTCAYCSMGCQLELFVKDGAIVKSQSARKAPSDGRSCFMGRFAYDFHDTKDRVPSPMVRSDGVLKESTWEDAIALIVQKLSETKTKFGSKSISCLMSSDTTLEDLYASKRLFGREFQGSLLECTSSNKPHFVNFSDLETYNNIIIYQVDLERHSPVAAAYIKQNCLEKAKLFTVGLKASPLTRIAKQNLESFEDLDSELQGRTLILHSPLSNLDVFESVESKTFASIDVHSNSASAWILGFQNDNLSMEHQKNIFLVGPEYLVSEKENDQFVVVIDGFLTENAQIADVLLPRAMWGECEGTLISGDGHINKLSQAVAPRGDCLPTWMIFQKIARQLQLDWADYDAKTLFENGICNEYVFLKDRDVLQPVDVESLHGKHVFEDVHIHEGVKTHDSHLLYFEKCHGITPEIVEKIYL
jgi:predicted molibdopterin-dependent oxidoreductase YjgC